MLARLRSPTRRRDRRSRFTKTPKVSGGCLARLPNAGNDRGKESKVHCWVIGLGRKRLFRPSGEVSKQPEGEARLRLPEQPPLADCPWPRPATSRKTDPKARAQLSHPDRSTSEPLGGPEPLRTCRSPVPAVGHQGSVAKGQAPAGRQGPGGCRQGHRRGTACLGAYWACGAAGQQESAKSQW
jgi:hypothetical protein